MRNYPPIESRLWGRGVPGWGGCVLFAHPVQGVVRAQLHWRGRSYPTSRIAYTLAVGEVPDDMWVLHHCDVAACINPHHLYVGTPNRNVQDRVDRGRQHHGERTAGAVLTQETALALFNDVGSYSELGRKYGVASSTARDVKKGRTWVRVTRADMAVAS